MLRWYVWIYLMINSEPEALFNAWFYCLPPIGTISAVPNTSLVYNVLRRVQEELAGVMQAKTAATSVFG